MVILKQSAVPELINGLLVVLGIVTTDVAFGTACLSQLQGLNQSVSWQPVQVQFTPDPPEGQAPQGLAIVTTTSSIAKYLPPLLTFPPGLKKPIAI